MIGIKSWDREQEDDYKTNDTTDRAVFFLPSEQSQYRLSPAKSLKEAWMDALWIRRIKDPAQKHFDQPFTELKASDLGLYNDPPRGNHG